MVAKQYKKAALSPPMCSNFHFSKDFRKDMLLINTLWGWFVVERFEGVIGDWFLFGRSEKSKIHLRNEDLESDVIAISFLSQITYFTSFRNLFLTILLHFFTQHLNHRHLFDPLSSKNTAPIFISTRLLSSHLYHNNI